MPELDKPTLFGRDDVLVEKLAKVVHAAAAKEGAYTELHAMHRGRWFEVRVGDGNHVMRVSVVLERVEEPASNPKQYCRYCKEQRTHGWDDCPFRLEALERMRLDREQGDLRTSTVDGARGFAESYGD